MGLASLFLGQQVSLQAFSRLFLAQSLGFASGAFDIPILNLTFVLRVLHAAITGDLVNVNLGIQLTPPTTIGRGYGTAEDVPSHIFDFESRFSTEAACREYLFRLRWPGGFVCPRSQAKAAWPAKWKWMKPCSVAWLKVRGVVAARAKPWSRLQRGASRGTLPPAIRKYGWRQNRF